MRSITKQLPTKRWIRSSVLLFLLASLLPVVLSGPASPARGRVTASTTKPAAPVTLRGEEAIAQLKQQGSYDSLAAAMAATRYQLRWVERPAVAGLGSAWQAANPAQGLQAFFTAGAVRIAEHKTTEHKTTDATTAAGKPARQTVAQPCWQFGMKLTGLGMATGSRV